jgi:glutamate 5-kinase
MGGLSSRRRGPLRHQASIVAEDSGALRADVIEGICIEAAARHAAGHDVVLVTSGAIARGMRVMGLPVRPRAIEELQAASAVGQGKLYRVYDELLRDRATVKDTITHRSLTVTP